MRNSSEFGKNSAANVKNFKNFNVGCKFKKNSNIMEI